MDIASCLKFYIGKTGMDPQEKFEKEYKKKYDRIRQIYLSQDKEAIEQLEGALHEYFINDHFYGPLYKNENEGSGGNMRASGSYSVYLVVKDR